MARPASSAAAITSSSRIDPPGWITASAPAPAAVKSPSAKGKNASEATTDPRVGEAASPSAYEAQSLDQYRELERLRSTGVRTPAAPPRPTAK